MIQMRCRETLLLVLALAALCGAPGRVLARGEIAKETYDALAEVHKLIENADYAAASARLDAIRNAKASPYEQALVLQTRGHLHARKAQYPEAIVALKKSLALGALPKSATRDTRYLLIQMQAAAAQWEDAAEGMDTWLASEKRPTARAQALAGSIYARAKRPEQSADRLRRAIDQSNEPPETWFRQLLTVYLEDARPEAAALLGDMVKRFPQRKAYWLQLAAVYRSLGDDGTALAIMELAHQRGLPFDETELIQLARFLIYKGLPHRAASLLDQALSDGTLSSSLEGLQLLSEAWFDAKEARKALAATERMLEVAPGAELQLRRAQLAAEIEDWDATREAAAAALSAGGSAHPGEAHLLRGIACYHLNLRADASEAFEQARSHAPSRDQAEQWMDFLSDEMAARGEGPRGASVPAGDTTDG